MLKPSGSNLDTLKSAIETLKEVCSKFGFSRKVEELEKFLQRLESPFLITVFGEVNAGKSSFLNALLGIPDLCRTDIDICTDRITVIRYCKTPERKKIDELTEEVCVNNPLLKGFTVVDTPGINSVLEHHTCITEQFLPKSDVILVVLPAPNPHTKPIWDWVDRIGKDFGKKLVFILQQKDLVSPEALKRLVEKVKTYARERGIEDPKVFPVSALLELKGEGDSGFSELRKFLEENYTGERQIKVKLLNLRNELIKFTQRCLKDIENLEREGEELKKRLEEVLNLLDRKLQEAKRYKEGLLRSVDDWIASLTEKVANRLEGISLLDLTLRKSKVEEALKGLKVDMEEELRRFTQYTLIPNLELFEEGVLKPAVAEAAERLREFERYQRKLGKKVAPSGEREVLRAFESSLGSVKVGGGEEAVALMGGSLLAGSLMMLLSGSLAVDITGGVIASLGVLLGVGWIVRKKRKLLKELKDILQTQIGERLKREIDQLVERRLEETLLSMRNYVKNRLETVEQNLKELKGAKERLISLLRELQNFNP